jgi:hypothetical protein
MEYFENKEEGSALRNDIHKYLQTRGLQSFLGQDVDITSDDVLSFASYTF